MVGLISLIVIVVLVVLTAATTSAAARQDRERRAAVAGSPLTKRARTTGVRPPAPPPGPSWAVVRDRFAVLQRRYAAYECDAVEVLTMPALADMTVPTTARFVDAFALAQSLLTEHEPALSMVVRFRRAVDSAEQAWTAALATARELEHSTLDPQERKAVERVLALLVAARDTDSEIERRAAYSLASTELAVLERTTRIAVPPAAVAALSAATRAGLTEG